MIRALAIGGDVYVDHGGTLVLFWHVANPILAPALAAQANDLIALACRATAQIALEEKAEGGRMKDEPGLIHPSAFPLPPSLPGPYDYDPDEWLGPEGDA